MAPSIADDYDAHPVVLGILSANGDSTDTEVEYAIKTGSANDGRDICFYESGKTGATWTTMPFAIEASGTFTTQDLDPFVLAPPAAYDLLVSGAPANPLPDITDDGTGSDTAALGTVRPMPDATDAGYGTDEAELAAAALFFDLIVSGIPDGGLGAIADAGEGWDTATLAAVRPLPGVVDSGEGGDVAALGQAAGGPYRLEVRSRDTFATLVFDGELSLRVTVDDG